MTNQEFDNLKLPIKLNFKESESVRLVLVHGFSVGKASEFYGITTVKISEILKMINGL